MSSLDASLASLDACTSECISFEELLGHCLAVYQSQRRGIQVLCCCRWRTDGRRKVDA